MAKFIPRRRNRFFFSQLRCWRSGKFVVHLRRSCVLAEPRVGLLLQFQRRRDVESLVRIHENDLTAGPHEAKQQRAFSGMRRDEIGHGVQLVRLQMRRVQPQMHLLGVFFRRILQRHDFLRENFRLVLAGADFADDEDRLFRFQTAGGTCHSGRSLRAAAPSLPEYSPTSPSNTACRISWGRVAPPRSGRRCV